MSTAAPAVTTPTVRAGVRRARYWLIALAFLIVVAVVTMLLTRGTGEGEPLSPDSPTPEGSRAIVEVLRDSGVDVDTATSFERALPAAEGATVLLYDPGHFLDPARMTELGEAADRMILVQPDAADLGALAPGVIEDENGFATEPVPVEDACAAASVDGSSSLWLDGAAYDASSGGCYEVADGRFSLVDAGDTVVLGSLLPLQNETVVREANAAFALRLLGADDRLVWYLPGPLDVDAALAPTLGELTPAWLPPASGLLVLAGVAAMVWRGRRFGPLVVENLPVLVRSSETMEGRARLYENSGARGRALDALRLGTLERLAARLGLPRGASVDDIVESAAAVLATDAARLRPLLIEQVPGSDADLVALSDDLLRLERSVDEATRAR